MGIKSIIISHNSNMLVKIIDHKKTGIELIQLKGLDLDIEVRDEKNHKIYFDIGKAMK